MGSNFDGDFATSSDFSSSSLFHNENDIKLMKRMKQYENKQNKQKPENEYIDNLINRKKNYFKDNDFNIYFITGYNTIYIKGYKLDNSINKILPMGSAFRDSSDLHIKKPNLENEKKITNIFKRSDFYFEEGGRYRKFFHKCELEDTIYFYISEDRYNNNELIEIREVKEYKPIMDDIFKIYKIINDIHGCKSFKTAINYDYYEPYLIDFRKRLKEEFIKFNVKYFLDKDEAIKQIKYFVNYQRWQKHNDENEF